MLTIFRDDPVDEFHNRFKFHMLVLVRVHSHNAVLIEQGRISLKNDCHVQLIFVLGGKPGTAVSNRVGPLLVGYALSPFHTLSRFEVPFLSGRFDPRLFPDGKLHDVGAGLVPP